MSTKETKEKRGRKRKTRDDELPSNGGENEFESRESRDTSKGGKDATNDNTEKTDKDPKKLVRTPSRISQLNASNQQTTPSSSAAPLQQSPSLSITPSLKIRLPRLSNFNMASVASSTNPDTPTKR